MGVQLPEVEREVRWPEYAAMARAAEDVGFDSIWVGDHLLYRGDGRPERGPWDAWTLLAGLAGVTDRVTLGPLVACTAFRTPGQGGGELACDGVASETEEAGAALGSVPRTALPKPTHGSCSAMSASPPER